MMSTRAKAGILNADNTVTGIFIWQDAYPEYAGRVLAKHYDTREKVEELMQGGNIRSLEQLADFCDYEPNTAPTVYKSAAEFLNKESYMVDYIYIFTNSKGWQYLKQTSR